VHWRRRTSFRTGHFSSSGARHCRSRVALHGDAYLTPRILPEVRAEVAKRKQNIPAFHRILGPQLRSCTSKDDDGQTTYMYDTCRHSLGIPRVRNAPDYTSTHSAYCGAYFISIHNKESSGESHIRYRNKINSTVYSCTETASVKKDFEFQEMDFDVMLGTCFSKCCIR
jgi:hypothetical protein